MSPKCKASAAQDAPEPEPAPPDANAVTRVPSESPPEKAGRADETARPVAEGEAAHTAREPAPTGAAHHGAPDPRSFEATFAELQRIVEQLEAGGLDLEQAVHLYDLGTTLSQTCERLVADAELRVTRLTAETASPLSDA